MRLVIGEIVKDDKWNEVHFFWRYRLIRKDRSLARTLCSTWLYISRNIREEITINRNMSSLRAGDVNRVIFMFNINVLVAGQLMGNKV